MNRLEHIGIAVKDLKKAEKLFEILLGEGAYKREKVDEEAVTTSFFRAGGAKIELLEATSQSSVVSKFIDKKGEGIHHIAFEVDNIRNETERLKKAGFEIIGSEPKTGADKKLVCFIHPRSTGGVLVELCQDIR